MPDKNIIIRPLPFAAPTAMTVPGGLTLSQMVDQAMVGRAIGTPIVEVNGIPIERDAWKTFVPGADDHVLIYTTVGNGMGDNPLRMILTIVVVAVATYYGGPAGGAAAKTVFGAGAAGIGTVVGTAAAMTAGMLLVDAIAPIRGLSAAAQQSYADSQAYSISAGSNRARPYGPIPMNLGRNLVYPDWAAQPYTELVGNDEYLRMLFCWGYGPQKIEDIKIGDTLLSSYSDVEIQTIEGFATDPAITLFPAQVAQTAVGVDLDQSAGWVTRTVAAGADELSWDVEFAAGLMEIDNSGGRQFVTVNLDMEYRRVGAALWTNLTCTANYAAQVVIPDHFPAGTHMVLARPDGTIYASQGPSYLGLYKPLGSFFVTAESGVTDGYAWTTNEITSVTDWIDAAVTGLNLSFTPGAGLINVSAGSATFPAIAFREKTSSTVRRGFRVTVDRAYAHEIRIKRITEDRIDNDRIVDRCRWSFLRAITNESPVNFGYPLALTALRIKATGQLSGVIDNFNGICTSYAQTFNGVSWGGLTPTQNPAALARLALMGYGAGIKARTASQMDEDIFGDWYEQCALLGYQFNQFRDFRSSIWETFADIAASARAAPAMPSGKWSVVVDAAGKSVAQHLTPRNSWGWSSNKKLFEAPHAFRVKFRNQNAGWEWDERIVYDDGYGLANATVFEQIEMPGITDPNLVHKFARFHIAQARLRPEEHYCYMDFERLAVSRGSKVLAASPVCLWGIAQGRVKSLVHPVVGEEEDPDHVIGVVLDDVCTMEEGSDYAVRFRRNDDTSVVVSVETEVGETTTLTFAAQIATSAGPAVGDLFMFGKADLETVELLVKRIESQSHFAARLTLVDLAEDIYSADIGDIPDYDSKVTGPVDITKIAPVTPTISNIESGLAALKKIGATVRARMLVSCAAGAGSNVRIARYQVRYRVVGASAWSYAACQVDTPTAVISDVIELEQYELSVQAQSIYGVLSAWSANYTETVEGSTQLPSDVEDLRIEIVGAIANLSWPAVTDIDLSGYTIKFSSVTTGATWATAYTIVDLVPPSAVSLTLPARQGTYLIKAVDLGERLSANAVAAINAFGDIQEMNAVETATEDPGFSGTHDRTQLDGSILRLADSSGVLEWDEAGGVVPSSEGGVEIDEGAAATVLTEGYYNFANAVDLGDVYASRVSLSMISGGVDLLEDFFAREDFFGVADFFGVELGDWNIIAQLRHTDDDPAGSPAWSAWKTFGLGDYTARAFEFRVLLQSLSPGISPAITDLSVTVDTVSYTHLTLPTIYSV